MATIRYRCRCGIAYAIYMRMSKMLKQLPDVPKEYIEQRKKMEETKKLEEGGKDGNIKYVNWRAKHEGMTFINGSTLEVFQCQCGATINLGNFIRKHISDIWRHKIIEED